MAISQIRAVRSADAVAMKRPSGENAAVASAAVWPVKRRNSRPLRHPTGAPSCRPKPSAPGGRRGRSGCETVGDGPQDSAWRRRAGSASRRAPEFSRAAARRRPVQPNRRVLGKVVKLFLMTPAGKPFRETVAAAPRVRS